METPEEVAAWVAAREKEGHDGIAALKAALTRHIIAGRGAAVARAWLDEREHGAKRRLEAEQLELARRATAASELAASAAVDSARHAGESALWAKIAAGIAVLALIVSGWPIVQPLLTPALKAASATAPPVWRPASVDSAKH